MSWRLNAGVVVGLAVILVFGVCGTDTPILFAAEGTERHISRQLGLDHALFTLLHTLSDALHQMRTSTYLAALLGPLLATKPAGAKLDITSETTLDCGAGPNELTAGYLDLDTGSMFFTLFHAREEARDKGLVIYFGGGPGATAWDYGLIGESIMRRISKDRG
jgi:hypothetical protein